MAHPVTHFEVNAKDARAMQQFYGDLFGWNIDTSSPQNYGMIDTKASGQGISGGIGPSQTGESWVTFYIDTPDPARTLQNVERLGGRTIMPPMDMGVVTYALFADPEGNTIGLVKSQPEPQKRSTNGRTATRRATATRSSTRKTTVKKPTAKRSTSRSRATTARSSSRGRSRR